MRQARAWDDKSKCVRGTANTKEPCNDTGTLDQTFDFINFFGNILGWKCNYYWKWKNNLRFWATVTFLSFTSTQVLYTQIMAFINGEYKKIFEVFALYGAAVSVTK